MSDSINDEQMSASITIEATPDAVFAVLADPTTHSKIDGTGWVRETHDPAPLTHAGQTFGMAMYHENHPDGYYEIVNRVEVLDAPNVIEWMPGYVADEKTGELGFGGWTWRYDLEPAGDDGTTVTLTYDWSKTGPEVRKAFDFPIFGQDHLDNSLQHLAQLATDHT